MADGARPEIVAVVTSKREDVGGGGVPIFFVGSSKEVQRVALLLKSPMQAVPAELSPETLVLIHHP